MKFGGGRDLIRHRRASKADVKMVMKHLSSISINELRHAGVSRDQAIRMMLDAMTGSDAFVFLDRATPIAVLVISAESENQHSTMFMATEGFFGARAGPSLYLRRFLDTLFVAKPDLVLRSQTYSDHEELHRWYRLMKYQPGIPDPSGNATVFFRRSTASES